MTLAFSYDWTKELFNGKKSGNPAILLNMPYVPLRHEIAHHRSRDTDGSTLKGSFMLKLTNAVAGEVNDWRRPARSDKAAFSDVCLHNRKPTITVEHLWRGWSSDSYRSIVLQLHYRSGLLSPHKEYQ